MRSLLALLGIGLVVTALLASLRDDPAEAHVGAVVAKAAFSHPAPPPSSGPYTPEEADTSYDLAWSDGDVDPTAKFTFYYFDHALPDAISADQVEQQGTLVTDGSGRAAQAIYASCVCTAIPDLGIFCPDMGPRFCPNDFLWDTSRLTPGAYWIAAVNNDPPYHVYNTSLAPVRVSHGGARPPVVLVTRPDGLMSADASYDITLIAVGSGAMTVDLAYGNDMLQTVLSPTTPIASGVSVTPAADGSWTYPWDVSALADGVYFVTATLHDASGIAVMSESRYGLGVYHTTAGDSAGAATADLAAMQQPPSPSGGCSVALHRNNDLGFFAIALFGAFIAFCASRRRALRRGCRSACTG